MATNSNKKDKNDLKKFIDEYKLQKIANKLRGEGFTVEFLLSDELKSEKDINDVAKELTNSIIQQKKFRFAVSQIRKQNKKNKSSNKKRSLSQISDDSNNKRQKTDYPYMITINVSTLTGKKIKINCARYSTIHFIKETIQIKECFPIKAQRLIFCGKILQDDKSLVHYRMYDSCKLHLVLTLSEPLTLIVESRTKKQIFIDCSSYDTIFNIKIKISKKANLSIGGMRLIYAGRELQDGRSVCDYKIKTKSIVLFYHCVGLNLL